MKFPRALVSFCTLAALGGCAYIIPPDQNVPRNNIVLGEPHRPQLNDSSMSNATSQPHSANTPRTAPTQDVALTDTPALPPADAATKAQAQQEMAQPPVMGERHVPIENTPFQMSANDGYPSLMNVPERPVLTGPGSTKDNLTAVQSDLQQDRANAAAASATLSRDAAAEPSMLAPMPQTGAVVPPNDPIVTAPIAPAPAMPSVTLPPHSDVRKIPAEQSTVMSTQPMAPLNLHPLPPQQADASYIASVPNFAPPAPMNLGSTPAITAQNLPAPIMTGNATRPNVRKGDFDPLAAADNAPIATASTNTMSLNAPTTYAGDGYLAASRYAAARRY